jgi:putative tricarboxylic transport membrane protein
MHETDQDDGPSLISNRTMDMVVAVLLLGVSGIVILDSYRLGFRWIDGEGPAPGYFPFYIAVVLAISSLINLWRAFSRREPGGGETFVSVIAFKRVLAVLLPTLVYVALIGGIGPMPGIGIYVASAIFIAGFMLVFGGNSILRTTSVAIAVPLALFFMFERWFLVPLPKGPLEALLGFN